MTFSRTLSPLYRTHASTEEFVLPCSTVLGLDLVNATSRDVVDWIVGRMTNRIPTRVAFLNAHCGNVAATTPEYRAALASACAVLPDGSGVALAARMSGFRFAANLNGTDLVPAICGRMAETGQSVFLFGGAPGVADSAAAALQDRYPGLAVAGCQDGFYEPEFEDAIVDRINHSGADLLLVALGVPAQDVWLHRFRNRITVPAVMGVGALFDFLSNGVPRAPQVLRQTGMEWAFRLYQEPKRLWRRYVLGNPAFLARAAVDAFKVRTARSSDAPVAPGKRALDIVVTSAALLAGLPLFAAGAIAIKATSPGPAIFRQERVGLNGQPFTMYKFRSMYSDAEARRDAITAMNHHGADCVTFKVKHDPRVTWVGRLLRRTSLDELPQLFNILKGDMSLVGPRPPCPQEVARYSESDRRRLAGRPGLTCLWQISGRADIPFAKQVELDVQYLCKQSLLTDLSILLRTIPAVLTARGAY